MLTLAFAFIGAALLATVSPVVATALAVGGLCGLANALDTMRASGRLLERRNVVAFTTGGFLRIIVFGLIPVWLVARGTLWGFGVYFVGFFMPLALYALLVARDIQAEAATARGDRRPLDLDAPDRWRGPR